jgi:hypothetical protein
MFKHRKAPIVVEKITYFCLLSTVRVKRLVVGWSEMAVFAIIALCLNDTDFSFKSWFLLSWWGSSLLLWSSTFFPVILRLLLPVCSYTNELQSSHPVFITPCVILQFHPCLRLPSENFASCYQPKSVLIFETVHAFCMSWFNGLCLTNGRVRITEIVNGKAKVHPRTGHEGLEGLYSFFNFRARWGGWSTPRHAPAALPPGNIRTSGIHCIGGWMGPRAVLDGCGKSLPHRDSIPGPPNP